MTRPLRSTAAPAYDSTLASDLALYRELKASIDGSARDILTNPATLARGLDPTFKVRPHTRVIAEGFAGLYDGDAGDYDRLMILCPPRAGKSTIAEWESFWWLIKHPRHRTITTSYSVDLAVRRGRRVRELVREHGATYGLHLSPFSASATDWDLTTGGGCRSAGIAGGITGHGAHLLGIDDPHKDRAEADSLRQRDNVWNWWSSTASTRLQVDSPVYLVCTPWHEDDLRGRLLKHEGRLEEGGRWKVVHLPAFADPKYGPDPLDRAPGEPLSHPEIPTREVIRLKAHWDDKKRTSTVRDWFALFQGDPQPVEGALVSRDLLRSIRDYTTKVEPQRIAVAVDPSGGGRDIAGIIGGFLGNDDRLWITHDVSLVGPSAVWSRRAAQLAADTNAQIIWVEANFGGDMAKLVISDAWDVLQREGSIPASMMKPMIEPKNAKVGKLLRAEPIAQQIISDRVRFRSYLPELEEEWATHQAGSPDSPGRIDASVYLAYGLLPVPGAAGMISSPAQVSLADVTGGGWAATPIDR